MQALCGPPGQQAHRTDGCVCQCRMDEDSRVGWTNDGRYARSAGALLCQGRLDDGVLQCQGRLDTFATVVTCAGREEC